MILPCAERKNTKIQKYKYTNTEIHKYTKWSSARKMMMVMMLAPHVLWRMFKMCVFCYFISRTFVSKDNCVCGLNENGWKRLIGQRLQNIPGNDQLGFPESFLFCMMERVPGGMFWAKVAHFGPPGTPRKSAFFYERGRKRMKEWRQVTFMICGSAVAFFV